MTTIAECLARSKELESVSDSARLDTEILLARVVNKPRTFLYTWADKPVSEQQLKQFEQWFDRRLAGEPIAYILGEKEFWSLTLRVDASTLIPRPETELLVETTLALLPESNQSVLDLGTGSGAIALALATERPDWQILAVDKSPAAIHTAIENCRNLNLKNVAINRSDWFANVQQHNWNAIVCNPPYIDQNDQHLLVGDVRFEPVTALVATENGLADLHKVIATAINYLADGGWLLVEHGWQQGEAVHRLFAQSGYSNINTKQDLAGHQRMTYGQYIQSR